MNYTDNAFLLFFLIVFVVYYAVRSVRLQIAVLVAASLFFYSYEAPKLLFVFLSSWFITSFTSYKVIVSARRTAKLYATLGVAANLCLLGFFKYKFLFIGSAADVGAGHYPSAVQWLLLAPLPIGISFYSFHGISLLVDVYRGNKDIPLKKTSQEFFSSTLLYLIFFPQLIAGPIIKAKDFYPQIKLKMIGEIDFSGSFKALVTGYFLKSVIADNMSDQTFWIAYPYFQWRSSADLLILLYGYSFQIFADFAGYSLVAIGLGRLLGYRLPDNFNFPYIATSLSDFWRRWHISLSSFLRDYLFIPLGGSRKGSPRTYINLFVVMLLGGLWHGAAWSFAIWGLWHGIGLVIERPFRQSRFMTSNHWLLILMRIFLVFNFVTLGWLLFKLQNFSDAWLYFKLLLHSDVHVLAKGPLLLTALYCLPVIAYHAAGYFKECIPQAAKNVLYGLMLFLILTSAGPTKPFIYFQF